MFNFWEIIHKVISEADILLIVLDSRMPLETRNIEIERKVQNANKPFIYVINKSDLVDKPILDAYKKTIPNSVFISAKQHTGTQHLREKIQIYASRAGLYNNVKVGVLGYPNVGKSSIINALSGRKAAPVSNISGFTKSLRNVRMTAKIMLLDTPGVIPYREDNDMKHVMIGTIDYSKEKDPEFVITRLMTQFSGLIEKYYEVTKHKDPYLTIEAIAKKRKLIAKGNVPDSRRAATMILKDWQTGKLVKK
jgi:ribosome biogenesis GTPase A